MRPFLFILALSTSVWFTQAKAAQITEEMVQVQLPTDETGKWKIDSKMMNRDGRVYDVWIKRNENQEQERIIISSAPYKTDAPSIEKVISYAISPIKIQRGANWEILQKSDSEALLKWTIRDETTAFCKLVLGNKALHSISYVYLGKHAAKVDQNKWTTFLKYSNIENTTLTQK